MISLTSNLPSTSLTETNHPPSVVDPTIKSSDAQNWRIGPFQAVRCWSDCVPSKVSLCITSGIGMLLGIGAGCGAVISIAIGEAACGPVGGAVCGTATCGTAVGTVGVCMRLNEKGQKRQEEIDEPITSQPGRVAALFNTRDTILDIDIK